MNEIESELLNLAMDHNISVEIHRDKPEGLPSFSIPDLKLIMINAAKDDYIFEFAHEIAHILNDDVSVTPLYYSATNRSKIELEANRTAIKLLLPYYCAEQSADQVRSVRFMESYGVPGWLESTVVEEIEEYYEVHNNGQ